MTAFKEYRSGLQALENQDYAEAVQRLEIYYQASPKPESLEHYQACKALVKAYEQVNEIDKALVLCEELAECKKPNIRSWAKRWQEKLANKAAAAEEPTDTEIDSNDQTITPKAEPLTPAAANQLLAEGRDALRNQQFAQAILVLQQFCQGSDLLHPDYYQAQMWLATAYQKAGQLQQATSLGQTLAENPTTQAWAEKFLQSLSVLAATQAVMAVQSPSMPTQSITELPQSQPEEPVFKQRSLTEFKDFCRQNLVDDLKEYEKKRKSALKALSIVGIVISVILIVILNLAPGVFMRVLNAPSPTASQCRQQEFTSLRRSRGLQFRNSPTTPQAYTQAQNNCKQSGVKLQSLLVVSAIFLMGLLGCLWSWAIFYSVQTEMYERGFKTRIIEKVIRFINNNQDLSYATYGDNYQTRMAILRSRLFPALNSTFYLQQDDCVFGKIGPANVFFSEVVAENEIHHSFMARTIPFLLKSRGGGFIKLPIFVIFLLFSFVKAMPFIFGKMIKGQRFDYDSFKDQVGNQVTRRQVFKGLFFRSDFNKNFQGETVVFTGSLASKLKQFNRPGHLVKLEDPEFNQLYTVYSDDQVEARYILSTSLMERLVKFRKKAQRPVSISFSENQIFIAIHHERDLFEARLFNTMLSFKPMQDYFDNFQLMLGIIQDLNLNRRIWTR
ncbi:DUF3137 domain-containing protein [Acaryochloris sp. IP29b_bin.148]|uniref:DUF3137 domain-containing protein n=1 Tax=Acaryochloris sp. IP29b_bin.148 TaxID=2969218 RepID=UPI00262C0C30|nr:DUF3137 domain-containing protein [Acaryochloris sp. IP29b_bin.148]